MAQKNVIKCSLHINDLWTKLKEYGLLKKGTPVRSFFYMIFPEEMLQQEPSVYAILQSKKASEVFNCTYGYVRATSNSGIGFYTDFGHLIQAYYGDIVASCKKLLKEFCRATLRPEQQSFLPKSMLSDCSNVLPEILQRFFENCVAKINANEPGRFNRLVYGSTENTAPADYAVQLAVIAIVAVFDWTTEDHFSVPFSTLPMGTSLQAVTDGSYRCKQLMLESGFKNNELEDFYKKWNAPLFLHKNHKPQVALKNLHLPHVFTLCHAGGLTTSAILGEKAEDFLLTFCLQTHKDLEDYECNEEHSMDVLYVTGQPGVGKSSFMAYLIASLFDNPKLYKAFSRSFQKLLVLSFKNLNREDLKRGLFSAIKLHTGRRDDGDFRYTLILLDGFDEIRLSNAQDRTRLLEEFVAQLSDFHYKELGLRCILTSRDGYLPKTIRYIDYPSYCMIPDDPASVPELHLEPFDYKMIQAYNRQYNKTCPDQPVQMLEFPEDSREKDCEIYGIPIILYMVHGGHLEVSHIEDKNRLYDALFSTKNGRIYAREEKSGDIKYEREKILCYDVIACQLAYRMYELGTGPAIHTYEERELVWSKRIEPDLKLLLQQYTAGKQRTNRQQTGITAPQIRECIDSVKDSYVSFNYYYEGSHMEVNDLEFIHKSIYEYYTGLYISRRLYHYIRLLSHPENSREEQQKALLHSFAQQIAALFFHHSLTDEIAASLRYHLHKLLTPTSDMAASSVPASKAALLSRKPAGFGAEIGFSEGYQWFHAGFQQLLKDGIPSHLHFLLQDSQENLLPFFNVQDTALGRFSNAEAIPRQTRQILEGCLALDYYLFTESNLYDAGSCEKERSFGSDEDAFASALHTASIHEHYIQPSYELSDCVLHECNLHGLDFRKSRLAHTTFEKCLLSRSNLSGLHLQTVCFSDSNLSHADFSLCEFSPASAFPGGVSNCILTHTIFDHANLSGMDISSCDGIQTASFLHANISGLCAAPIKNSGLCAAPIKNLPEGPFPTNRFFYYDMQTDSFRFPKGESILDTSVYFGRYPQNHDGQDKDSGVAWQVIKLERSGNRVYALLLAEQVLDVQPYAHKEDTDAQWKNCHLYRYLNGEFLNRLCSHTEQQTIIDRGKGKLFLWDPICISMEDNEFSPPLQQIMQTNTSHYAHDLKKKKTDSVLIMTPHGGTGSGKLLNLFSNSFRSAYWTDPIYDIKKYSNFPWIKEGEKLLEFRDEAKKHMNLLLKKENNLRNSGQFQWETEISGSEIAREPESPEPKLLSYVDTSGTLQLSPASDDFKFINLGVRPSMWMDVTHLFDADKIDSL